MVVVVGVLSTAADPLLPLLGVSIVMGGCAWTCTDFDRVQIRTQVDANFSSFANPTLVDTSQSQVICICMYGFLQTCKCVWTGLYARV